MDTVGNTSEASSSIGESSLSSPFSVFYTDPTKLMRSNPPLTPAERASLTEFAAAGGDLTIPVHMTLSVAGCIVNKEWESALFLCEKIVELTQHKKQASSIDHYCVYNRLSQYLRCIVRGVDPVRRADRKADRADGRGMVSLWADIRRSALAAQGNVKLPFAAYSEMPAVTCPGAGGIGKQMVERRGMTGPALGVAKVSKADAGGCAGFCYSFKGLRNPTVCQRLTLLTLGMTLDPKRHIDIIGEEVLKLRKKKKNPIKILRLFVDGDFRDERSIVLWMEKVKQLNDAGVTVYGYSKSWPEFLRVHKKKGAAWWPKGYVLNISSGSLHSAALMEKMRGLPISRGEFYAVHPLQRLLWKAMTKRRGDSVWQAYQRRLNRVAASDLSDSKIKVQSEMLRERVVRLIQRVNPDLVAKYNQFVGQVEALDMRGSPVMKTLKQHLGDVAAVPGPVVQASTYAFLHKVKEDGETPCPISCGACPSTAIPLHEQTIERAMLGDTEFLAGIKAKIKTATEAARKNPNLLHMCADHRLDGRRIIIGLH